MSEYDDTFVAGLEWMWGEGFLSPGGAAEVAEIIYGINVKGRKVLDIGCGIGGIDVLLVKEHGAAHVTAIDVEAGLIAKARATAARAGVAEYINFQLVTPGPLPFAGHSFDLVFSKDSMIHIPDKAAIYQEIYRVLKPGGYLAVSDWYGSDEPQTPEFKAWLEIVGLSFRMGTLAQAEQLVSQIGFSEISGNDRNTWYRQEIKRELASQSGENFPALVQKLGPEAAQRRLNSTEARVVAVEQGQLRPGHLRARKP